MNKFLFSIRKNAANLIAPNQKNRAFALAEQFLRYGNRERMMPNWQDSVISDEDQYTGYGYAAIFKRAQIAARTAIEKVKTESNATDFVHPYLDVLDRSPSFSNYFFWVAASTYLDLEGVFYIMAIRNYAGGRRGNIQEFKILNPYFVKRLVKYGKNGMEVIGYEEVQNGLIRQIPPEMIIDFRELNPFRWEVPFAMTDAAKDTSFTFKTASNYTRGALRNNINAPGILATDVELEEEQFKNFMDRVRNHPNGEPIFSNGGGAVKWDSMQIELGKAALEKINDVTRDEHFSIAGLSKTLMGIEQSGTTRDTARVQKELAIEMAIMPRLQTIIDTFNQDFKNSYPDQYAKNKATLFIDSPFSEDYDAALQDVDLKTKQVDLFQTLINRGVDNKTAAEFVRGDASLEDLKLEKQEQPPALDPNNPTDPNAGDENNPPPKKKKKPPTDDNADNALQTNENKGLIQQQQGSLQNNIVAIDHRLLASALNRLPKKIKNSADLRQKDVITQDDQNTAMQDLNGVLIGFYGIVVNLQGQTIMRDRAGEYAMQGLFNFDRATQAVVKMLANKAAESHINTISNDIFKLAADAASEGKSLKEIESLLTTEFNDRVTNIRAKSIARTETNRAFTIAQYQADLQFVNQNDLGGKAYKKWETRSDNPCPFCNQLASEPAIPIEDNFRDLGDTIEADKQTLNINYTDIEAGNAHPNCSCTYRLIIKSS